jgi:uncharacterized membrane protein
MTAMASEGLGFVDYVNLAEGKIITQRRATPADKSGVHVAAFGIMRTSQEVLWNTVADCERQPEFMPHFDLCETVAPDKPLPPNERWNLNRLSFGVFPFKARIEVIQHAVLDKPNRLSWSRVKGDTKVSEGYWRIIPLDKKHQLLAYDTLSDPGAAVPDVVQRMLTEHDLPKTVEAVRQRVEDGLGKR